MKVDEGKGVRIVRQLASDRHVRKLRVPPSASESHERPKRIFAPEIALAGAHRAQSCPRRRANSKRSCLSPRHAGLNCVSLGAAMSFRALLACEQINVRKVNGWQTLASGSSIGRWTSPLE